METEVREIFNNLADTYKNEWIFSEIEQQKLRDIVNQFGLKEGMRVIEAGCGKGDFSPFILEKIGKNGMLYLVDISERMLDYARKKLSEFPNVAFLNENVKNIKIPAESIDMIVCFNSFPHFIDKLQVLIKFNRLLKKDGTLIIAHNNEREKINEFHFNCGFNTNIHYLPEKYILESMLNKTGFCIVRYHNDKYYLLKAVKNENI